MSLLDGLKDSMVNPIFDSIMESDMDAEFEFETALEAVIDKQIELSAEDISAILDDENPDNIVSDMTKNDEKVSKIAEDSVDEDMQALEALLDELLAVESETPESDEPAKDPESLEGCSKSACEMDDGADDEAEVEDVIDELDDDDDDNISLDSLLAMVFNN